MAPLSGAENRIVRPSAGAPAVVMATRSSGAVSDRCVPCSCRDWQRSPSRVGRCVVVLLTWPRPPTVPYPRMLAALPAMTFSKSWRSPKSTASWRVESSMCSRWLMVTATCRVTGVTSSLASVRSGLGRPLLKPACSMLTEALTVMTREIIQRGVTITSEFEQQIWVLGCLSRKQKSRVSFSRLHIPRPFRDKVSARLYAYTQLTRNSPLSRPR